MIAAPFIGSLQTAVQVQTGSGQWANGIRLLNKAAPAANAIRPFVRPLAPVLGPALLTKAGLVIGVFAAGYGIGTLLKDALLKPNLKPIDSSQPTDPNAQKSWLTQPAPPEGMTINVTGQMGTEGAEVTASLYYTDSRVSGSGCTAPTDRDQIKPYKRTITASGGQLKYYNGERSENDCGWLGVSLSVLRTMPSSGNGDDADWERLAGLSSSGWRPAGGIGQAQFDVEFVPLGDPLPDLPLPIWTPAPDAEPLPEVETEDLPQRIPTPVTRPAVPAAVPGGLPLPTTTPGTTPNKVPAPVKPAVSPALKPATKPATTTATKNNGAIVPKKPGAITTTPKDVHLFGNAGGRVAGRTASLKPSLMAQELGRVEQKMAQINKGGLSDMDWGDFAEILGFLMDLWNSPTPGTTYTLESACECDPEDENCEEETLKLPIATQLFGDGSIARLDAIAEMLQPLKTWKQPICRERPELQGDFRTISFVSDQRSPFGNDRLRKRFRYRSQSGIGLAELVEHWKDFTWSAGDVCVQHSGSSWGTPQVWAASADEGKRVILHAAREAGIDPNQTGKWTIGGSNNPRFGVPGTMRVNTKGGFYWITERLGSDGKPIVVER